MNQCPFLGAEWEPILVRDALRRHTKGQEQGRVQIADVEAALEKVRGFITLLEESHRIRTSWGPNSQYPQLRRIEHQIEDQLPLIRQIAARADPMLVAKLKKSSITSPWLYHKAMKASRQLAGLLGSAKEVERILGPAGPSLNAASLHPWIWAAAVNLWDDGHRREAVRAAAAELFDRHLPAKLSVPAKPSTKDLVAQAFSTDPPTAGSPRLRLDDYPDSSPSWTSQHDGAKFFGMGCAQLIRNLVTHGC
jgi:hypothetical protein